MAHTLDGTTQAVASFDPTNVTSKANRTKFEYGAPCQTLHTGGMSVAHALKAEGHDGSEDGTGRGVPLVPVAFDWQASGDGDTSFRGKSRSYTVRKPGASGALSSCKTEGLFEPATMSVRRLTPLECCRLQAFPDSWLDGLGLSDSAKYRMLGNAVCTNVVEWIGRRLKTYLERTTTTDEA